jgi:hypothetical protein
MINHDALIFKVLLGLLDPEDEGTIILQNGCNYLPSDTVTFLRTLIFNSYAPIPNRYKDTYCKKYGESLLYEIFGNNASLDAITQNILDLFPESWNK